MDNKLHEILACPLCKGKLQYLTQQQELLCRAERIAFPINDGIPVMLESEARLLTAEDLAKIPAPNKQSS